MNNNQKIIQILNKWRSIIKRIFPQPRIQLALFIAILALTHFSVTVLSTATIGQEQTGIDATIDHNQGSTPTDDTHQSDFELNGSDQPNTEIQVIEYPSSQMCFIGDSRVVGMQNAVLTDACFIADVSVGLDWFNHVASAEFEKLRDRVGLCVVALGVNDINNADAYIGRLNQLAEQYPEKVFVYANIGPVDETQYTTIDNRTIEEFNQKMRQGLNGRWQIVDQYTYLAAEGFNTVDGLHYTAQDSAKIFAWIVNTVKNQVVEVAVAN